MGRNLTRVSDENHRDYFEFTQERLEKRLAKQVADDAPLAERIKHAWLVGDYSFQVGAGLYQQEGEVREIRAHLERAAEFFVRMHELRGAPASNENRDVWTFLKTIAIACCFGSSALRRRIATLDELAYRHPPKPITEAPSSYVELLKRHLGGVPVDRVQLQTIEARCAAADAPDDWRDWVLPAVRGLAAVLDRDASALEHAVAALLGIHEHDARHTEFGGLSDAFLCLPALLLVQLGREAGISCEIASPYLPLELLDAPPASSTSI